VEAEPATPTAGRVSGSITGRFGLRRFVMSALIYIVIAFVCLVFVALSLSGLQSHNPK
jgi:hypothetical protein